MVSKDLRRVVVWGCCLFGGIGLLWMPLLWADCVPRTGEAVMATPLSSRINQLGDPVQAVLEKPLLLNENLSLPAGTLLRGKVVSIHPSQRRQAGSIQFCFTEVSGMTLDNELISAFPATTDGWLHQADADTPVWQVSPTRSTRLLNERLQRRLTSNRAVWAQVLGINENTIPDVTTDAFIYSYSRQDVLVGAGDHLLLRFNCMPNPGH